MLSDNKIIKDAVAAEKDIAKNFMPLVGAGLAVVTGIAWNDAVKLSIDYMFPSTADTLMSRFAYAILFTIVVVLIKEAYGKNALARK